MPAKQVLVLYTEKMTFFTIVSAFFTPLIVAEFYSSREYELIFIDHFEKWGKGKLVALIVSVFFVVAHIIWDGNDIDSIISVLFAGIWLSLVLYSKPFGELFLGNAEIFKKAGLLEDAAFFIGWVGIIHQSITYFIYWYN
ncbi:hypothetical protein [Pseudoalteromonas phenolica]|uniref:hypothetical protein n=1 Tax=Pseudoalteromonas phenolica TaxID=161398 RepID=UPI00071773D0|nr:hypothetical protein [Pseudoalteromonas phenolica]MBE0357344.1 hypothetical protein [Pseudoalteromonas phenolica O-BC30]